MTGRGFVHAAEQNHLHLSTVGGGRVVQLDTGKAVTSQIDPLLVYNYVFGVRRNLDLEAATRAFRAAGRDYLHVAASPSSWAGLPEQLELAGFHRVETQAYRRTEGTGAGAPGLLPVGPDGFDRFFATWTAAWGAGDAFADRREAVGRRFGDPRSRPYRTADGSGVLILFDAGPTTQLIHFGVEAGAQGRGVGRRMLELAGGLVPSGRPLWLFARLGGPGDRAAAAAGWALTHRAENWLLALP